MAFLDRLVERAIILKVTGKSYRSLFQYRMILKNEAVSNTA